jgi:hypothetical protein
LSHRGGGHFVPGGSCTSGPAIESNSGCAPGNYVATSFSADYVFRFGAMMSWQDHGLEDEATRRRDATVTRALSTAINRCLVAAVNETPWDRETALSKTSA